MKLWFSLLSVTVLAVMAAACNPSAPQVTWISVDFPHGELRLHVWREGDAKLLYGALPASLTIPNHIFDIDDLYQQLEPRLQDVASAENRPIGQPYGMATIELSDGSERDYLIYDEVFALELFQVACTNAVENEKSGAEIITAACDRLGSIDR